MPFDLDIINKRLMVLRDAFRTGEIADILVTGLNAANGFMQERIFTNNRDADGNSFGKYIGEKKRSRKPSGSIELLTSYERKRVRAGRQIARKDLEFYGGLRRAIEVRIEDYRTAVIEFNNDEAAKIGRGQENQLTNIRKGLKGITKGDGTKVFTLDQDEEDQMDEQIRALLNDHILSQFLK